MAEIFIPTSLDMITHKEWGRGMPIRTLGLVDQFFGKPGKTMFRGVREHGMDYNPTEDLIKTVEGEFAQRIVLRYGLPDTVNPLQFFHESEQNATTAIRDLVARFPGSKQTLELAEEAKIWTEHPSEALQLLALKAIDLKLRFELLRRVILSDTDAQIRARITADKPRSTLLQTLLILDDIVYEGEIGANKSFEAHSYHDRFTNTFKGLVTRKGVPPGSIERKHPFSVRIGKEGVGPVYMTSRIKGSEASLLKALIKAQDSDNGGLIDPYDVTDNSGILFVVMDESKFYKFIGSVITGLEHHPRNLSIIELDNKTGRNRGQSAAKFERWQATFGDAQAPLELQFFKLGDYLNQLYEVGKKDRKTEYYMGSAHELYELRRIAALLLKVFPQFFYGDAPREAIREAMERKAQELIERNKVN